MGSIWPAGCTVTPLFRTAFAVVAFCGIAVAAGPTINPGGVISVTGIQARPASPGSLIAVYGSRLASASQASAADSQGRLPVALTGTTIRLGATAMPLLYVSPGQINALVPLGISPGTYSVTVSTAEGTSAAESVQVTATSPAVFSNAIVKLADNSVADNNNPFRSGDVWIVYCTGLGAVSPTLGPGQLAPSSPISFVTTTPTVTVGGRSVQVVNAVLTPGFVGLYQVGIVIPAGLPLGVQDLVVSTSGASSPAVAVSSAVPWVTITSIWSEQLSNGVIANFLPGGAGTRGNSGSYVLLGTAPDGTIHAGATLQVPAGISSGNLKVRLALLGSDGGLRPVGAGTLTGQNVSLAAPAFSSVLGDLDPVVPEYEVVAFDDANGNGLIDTGEAFSRSRPSRFKVITPARYGIAKNVFVTGANVPLDLPFAKSFLNSFVYGTPPTDAQQTTSSVTNKELSHSVGVTFTSAGTSASAAIPKYTFPAKIVGGLSQAVLASIAFQNALSQAVAGTCSLSSQTTPITVNLNSLITFDKDHDLDLGLTFGTATLTTALAISAGTVQVKGSLTDLYDWDFEAGVTGTWFGQLLDPMGASLQAGSPTINRWGVIFRSEVQFDDTLPAPGCPLSVTPSDSFALSGAQGSISGSKIWICAGI